MGGGGRTYAGGALGRKLLGDRPSLLGFRFPVLVGVCAGGLVVGGLLLILFLVCSSCRSKRPQWRRMRVKHASGVTPAVTKEIAVVETGNGEIDAAKRSSGEVLGAKEDGLSLVGDRSSEKGSKVASGGSSSVASTSSAEMMSNIGWGRWYTLAELEAATGCFRRENVVGEGGYGIVYKGILPDSSVVAVKNLLDNRYVKSSKTKSVFVLFIYALLEGHGSFPFSVHALNFVSDS